MNEQYERTILAHIFYIYETSEETVQNIYLTKYYYQNNEAAGVLFDSVIDYLMENASYSIICYKFPIERFYIDSNYLSKLIEMFPTIEPMNIEEMIRYQELL